jgi:hypothetical protein
VTTRIIAGVAGAFVVLGMTSSVLRTLIVPRGLTSWFAHAVIDTTTETFHRLADLTREYEARDRVLAWGAPAGLILLLGGWLAGYFVGYGLLEYAVTGDTLGHGFRAAGSSLFTLGFVPAHETSSYALDFVAAATGPVVIALQIAYLPTLYSAYNRRETDVTLLESRAGEPAWGPELLARHQLIASLDALPPLYASWERWSADVSESHTSYPMLVHFRSPQPYRSWIIGLLAVMDSAALYLALCPARAPSEARLCLRMGFVSLRSIADVHKISYESDPRPNGTITLTREDFDSAIARLERVEFPLERSADEAWQHFVGWRINYESIAYALALRVDAVPALWSGPRRHMATAMAPQRPANRRPDNPDDD